MFWKKSSTIGAWLAGITAIIHIVFQKYIQNYIVFFFAIEGLGLSLYLISEIMKLIKKNQEKKY
jgi:hypothetical protein